jgi:pyruvate/2-oxoglutarate dehydrogenase complex dihydrolipoamide acyltransferase (E2) component
MPQLGETVAEGKITKWFKAAGDAVKPGDNLFEIETDKTSMEVPATAAGVLAEIRARVGEVVPVGAVVAVISDGKGAAAGAGTASVASTNSRWLYRDSPSSTVTPPRRATPSTRCASHSTAPPIARTSSVTRMAIAGSSA